MTVNGNYFYGNEISDYGKKHGYVDYSTLSKAFDSVLNNNIFEKGCQFGDWEQESGTVNYQNEIDELQEKYDNIQEMLDNETTETSREYLQKKLDEIQEEIDELTSEMENPSEVFQWYIISPNGAEILKKINEIVYYHDELDMYLWGVTHWGTSWDYVLTDIKITPSK